MTDFGQINCGPGSASLLVHGDGKPALIFNGDITTVVYLMDDKFGTPGDSTGAAPLQPLGYAAFDGKKAIWGQTLAGTAVCDVMPGAVSASASPAQIAAQINALGLAKDTSVNAPAFGPAKDSSVNAPSYGPARDTSLGIINGTLGTPAQTADVNAVKTTLGTPAQTADVNAVKTTLGTPAQTADVTGVKNAVNAPSFGPAKDATLAAQTSGGTIANEIYGTGVNLRHDAVNLVNDALHNIPANSTVTIVTGQAISKTGYTASITALCAAATVPTVTVTFTYSDSTSGKTVWVDTWNFFVGSTATGSGHFGSGPTKGDTLKITVTNNDPANAFTVTTVYTENSRLYTRDDWRTNAINTIPGFTSPNRDDTAHLLAEFNASIGASGSATRLIPFYAGKVEVVLSCPANNGAVSISAQDPAFAGAANLGGFNVNSGNTGVQEIALPRCWTTFTITNLAASAATFILAVVVAEYLP